MMMINFFSARFSDLPLLLLQKSSKKKVASKIEQPRRWPYTVTTGENAAPARNSCRPGVSRHHRPGDRSRRLGGGGQQRPGRF